MHPQSKPSPEIQEAIRKENKRCAEFIRRGIRRGGIDAPGRLTVLGNLIAMRVSCIYRDREGVRKWIKEVEAEIDELDAAEQERAASLRGKEHV